MEVSRKDLFSQYSTFCKTNGVKLGVAGIITCAMGIFGAYLVASHNIEPTMWNRVVEPLYGISESCLGVGVLFLLASALYSRKAAATSSQQIQKQQAAKIKNVEIEKQVDALAKKVEDKYLLSFKSAMIGLALLVSFAANAYFHGTSPGSLPVDLLMYGSLAGALGMLPIAAISYVMGARSEAKRDHIESEYWQTMKNNWTMIKDVKPVEDRKDFGLVNYFMPSSN